MNAELFLQSLKEMGISEIYMPVQPQSAQPAQIRKTDHKSTGPSESQQASELKSKLIQLKNQTAACTLCKELSSTRKNVVFGSGNIRASLLFVGEAPGKDEDEQGLPFVGRAGQLLTKIIESIGFNRTQVFIANTLKCRPPQNRQPHPDELSNCRPFLDAQIQLIQPKIICALGTFAAQSLLKSDQTISSLRGRFHVLNGIKVMCTFHPAYLLRNPDEKRKVWEDMKAIKRELESPQPLS